MKENLINISVDKENVFVGNHLQELEDCSVATFQTDDLESFIKYLGSEKMFVFVGAESVKAFGRSEAEQGVIDLFDPEYEELPAAVCSLAYHPIITLLQKVNGDAMPLAEFQKMLDMLRMYLGENEQHLKDMVRSFSMNKVVDVQKSADTRGNVLHKIQIADAKGESKGNKDVEFPETVKFTAPLFSGMPDQVTIEFDLIFEWAANSEGDLKLLFTINNFMLTEILREHKKAMVNDKLLQENFHVLAGDVYIRSRTNVWKYYKNSFEVKHS